MFEDIGDDGERRAQVKKRGNHIKQEALLAQTVVQSVWVCTTMLLVAAPSSHQAISSAPQA
jgi:hypothetical protein